MIKLALYSRGVFLVLLASVVLLGCGDDSRTVDDAGMVDEAPMVGSEPVFSAVTTTSLTLTWGAAADAVTPPDALRYKVVRATSPDAIDSLAEVDAITSGADLVLDVTPNTLTADVSGLSPGAVYSFAVVVADAATNRALYPIATATTFASSTPVPGAALSFTGITTTAATVNWGAAADDTTPTTALQYKVVRAVHLAEIDSLAEVAAITSGYYLVRDFTATTTSVAVTDLTTGRTYAFAVVVKDTAGNEALYSPAQVTTTNLVPPTVGDPITFPLISGTEIVVRWGEATDDTTTHGGLQYKAVRAATTAEIDTLAEVAAITSGPALLLDFSAGFSGSGASGLAEGTTYAFAVVVRDPFGNQALYAPATATTLDATDPTVTITSPSAPTSTTPAATVSLAGTTADAVGVTSVTWVNTTTGASGAALGTTDWSVMTVALVAGANVITITASDAAGNTGTAMTTVTRDNAAPIVTITAPTTAATFVTTAATVALGGTASDPGGLDSVFWANTTNGTSGTATGTTAWSIASITLAAGSNVIAVGATDSVGNTGTAMITVQRDP